MKAMRSDAWTAEQDEVIRAAIRAGRPLSVALLDRLGQCGPARTLGAAKTRRHRLAEEMPVPLRPVRAPPAVGRRRPRGKAAARPALRLVRQGDGFGYTLDIPGGPVTGWRAGTEAAVRRELDAELRAYLERAAMLPGTAYCPQYSRRGGGG